MGDNLNEDIDKQAMRDRYLYSGAARSKTKQNVIYRHDLYDVPTWIERHLCKYRLDQRVALVYFIFHENYTLKEAAGLIDDGWCDRDGIDWNCLDSFALDNSKTFLNMRRYL